MSTLLPTSPETTEPKKLSSIPGLDKVRAGVESEIKDAKIKAAREIDKKLADARSAILKSDLPEELKRELENKFDSSSAKSVENINVADKKLISKKSVVDFLTSLDHVPEFMDALAGTKEDVPVFSIRFSKLYLEFEKIVDELLEKLKAEGISMCCLSDEMEIGAYHGREFRVLRQSVHDAINTFFPGISPENEQLIIAFLKGEEFMFPDLEGDLGKDFMRRRIALAMRIAKHKYAVHRDRKFPPDKDYKHGHDTALTARMMASRFKLDKEACVAILEELIDAQMCVN